jgi:hypothetical protein
MKPNKRSTISASSFDEEPPDTVPEPVTCKVCKGEKIERLPPTDAADYRAVRCTHCDGTGLEPPEDGPPTPRVDVSAKAVGKSGERRKMQQRLPPPKKRRDD